MDDISSNTEFFALLRRLVDAWCDRRALRPLSLILNPYLAFDGLTGGWGEILDALKSIRAECRADLLGTEMDAVENLVRAAETTIYRRQSP